MKQTYSGTPTGVTLFLFATILIANGFATYFDHAIIPNITKVISVMVILTVYYTHLSRMANVFLTIFLLQFLGDAFSVFNFGALSYKLAIAFYLGSYLLLVFVLLGKLKRIKFEGLISIYLVLILLLNSYFLFMLYEVLRDNFTDSVYMVLSICHGITLIAMAFLAFAVYLSKESKQSIIFLVMVCCFAFSDVLNYICQLYVYYWMFDFIGNMLHVISMGLFFVYVYNHHKIINTSNRETTESYLIKRSERLTA